MGLGFLGHSRTTAPCLCPLAATAPESPGHGGEQKPGERGRPEDKGLSVQFSFHKSQMASGQLGVWLS